MEIKQYYLTENRCYKKAQIIKPTGIMVHSTGANNPYLARYIQPDDGILGDNANNNDWNQPSANVLVHAMIGKDANNNIKCYQLLPWNYRSWGCGSGKNGSGNNSLIQFEICEDNLKGREYFDKVYDMAIELCVYLCLLYGFDETKIICHSEGFKQGIASNHSDVMHWFPIHGKDMNIFRKDVKDRLEDEKMFRDLVNIYGEEDVKKALIGLIEYSKKEQAPSDWAEEELNLAIKEGITDGSRPQDFATRQETAIMVHRALKK